MDFKDKLTGNFTLGEFFATNHDEALLRKEFLALPTIQQDKIKSNIIILANRLQVVRDVMDVPISILSGWRSDRVNKLVGGAENSCHRTGQAADLGMSRIHMEDAAHIFRNWDGGLGHEGGKLHMDIGTRRRWLYGK